MVEGAGGWLAPISAGGNGNRGRTMQDVAALLGLPVMMVVGIRLGCLNHALLTEAAIARSGLPLVGWIANPLDPHFSDAERYVASLEQELAAPLLWRAPRVILPGQ
jgi:dethiobiotin synthetase